MINNTQLDLSKLDFNEIGSWPQPMRLAIIVLAAILVIIANYFFFIQEQCNNLSTKHQQHLHLRTEFREKYHQAANLAAYQQRIEEVKATLRTLLLQLPTEGNLPTLMEDLSLQATTAGLEFTLIKPGTETSKEFYTELPINMSLLGNFHGFALFISGLANLPRIVTLHDFEITINKTNNNQTKTPNHHLSMKIDAKTFWCHNREKI